VDPVCERNSLSECCELFSFGPSTWVGISDEYRSVFKNVTVG